MENQDLVIFWFRRDLRLEDNAGLYQALKSGYKVLPIFIFDKTILDKLPEEDRRVCFIWEEVNRIKNELENLGSGLKVFYSTPEAVFKDLTEEYSVKSVFANRDYEPSAINRDKFIYNFLQSKEIPFKAYKDQVIFDRNEVLKDDGKPYTVYTPYMKRWKLKLNEFYLKSYPSLKYTKNLFQWESESIPSLEEMSFKKMAVQFPGRDFNKGLVASYHETRDLPYKTGTSRLSVHLRFGTISIRTLSRQAREVNEKFYNELIWREFYQMILYHFPNTVNEEFKPAYSRIEWEKSEEHFKKWCSGKTGFPMVDAGMRELNATGFMHNRVRMLTASFLTKHLLLDWRLGEAYFAEKLLDFDQASNVGGWQWAAGCGVDAAPYFRVFNPSLQQERFDPNFEYIKRWVPEFGTEAYPDPIVDHKQARLRAIKRFKEGLA